MPEGAWQASGKSCELPSLRGAAPDPRSLAPLRSTQWKGSMGRQATVVLYALVLIAVVVGVDVLFFRDRFWGRLMVNVGIVLVFGAFYLRFLNHP